MLQRLGFIYGGCFWGDVTAGWIFELTTLDPGGFTGFEGYVIGAKFTVAVGVGFTGFL